MVRPPPQPTSRIWKSSATRMCCKPQSVGGEWERAAEPARRFTHLIEHIESDDDRNGIAQSDEPPGSAGAELGEHLPELHSALPERQVLYRLLAVRAEAEWAWRRGRSEFATETQRTEGLADWLKRRKPLGSIRGTEIPLSVRPVWKI